MEETKKEKMQEKKVKKVRKGSQWLTQREERKEKIKGQVQEAVEAGVPIPPD